MSLAPRNPEHNPLRIIARCRKEGRPMLVAGPMVRYSKLPFRQLVRKYKADLVYSPMILAREFVRSANSRIADFTTNSEDRPLIVQIGTNNVADLLRMCEMIHPYVDAIGLNCGCPIPDQVRQGIGAALMSKKELVCEMVRAVKSRFGDSLTMEIKIRVHPDIDETIEFVQAAENAGVDFITVHGRTKATRSSIPVDLDKIRIVKEHATVPIIANGDCFSLEDAYRIAKVTGCDGVMAVRGILDNPALFAGYDKAPWGSVELLWDYTARHGLPVGLLRHHLSCMLQHQIPRKVYIGLNECNSFVELIDYFDEHFVLKRRGEPGFAQAIDVVYR